ncbi:MAG: hypothetical protein BWY96_02385 [Spirochaetes bacterium ADurb.BinA120]|nr:MAG: hypothetical protein BWY96_02385 [Spirochaetes bacterium ADurb.BinA120]
MNYDHSNIIYVFIQIKGILLKEPEVFVNYAGPFMEKVKVVESE